MTGSHQHIVTKKYINELTYQIIGAAIEVHKYLGPCLLESVYKKCLERELELKGISFTTEEYLPLDYKGMRFPALLRYDMIVEELIIVELKTIETVLPIHEATTMSYMKLLYKPKGILLNFHSVNIWKDGQKTFVNEFFSQLPDE